MKYCIKTFNIEIQKKDPSYTPVTRVRADEEYKLHKVLGVSFYESIDKLTQQPRYTNYMR